MPESKRTRKLYWTLQICGWLTMVCIESVNYTFFIVGNFSWDYTQLFLYGALLGLLFTHSFKLIIARFGVFAWRARTLWLLAFFATLLISLLINTLFYLPPVLQDQITIQSIFEPINFFSGIVNWARYVGVWVILYFLYQILERARKIEQEKLRSENAARVTELELLKTQLNPHFLFNALNSIKALVSIDQEKSRDAIVKLSELLRYTLNYGNQQLIPLHDELAEVKKYWALEQIRFGSRLQVQIDVEDATLNRLIPPAIILTLAENAIKHGVAKHSGDCLLQLKALLSGPTLAIEMINPGKLELSGHTGIGLQNIQKRLHHFFGQRFMFTITEQNEQVIASIILTEL